MYTELDEVGSKNRDDLRKDPNENRDFLGFKLEKDSEIHDRIQGKSAFFSSI